MKNIRTMRTIAILVLVVCMVAPMIVYAASTVTCMKCHRDNATCVSKTKITSWDAKNHYRKVTYYINCPKCGEYQLDNASVDLGPQAHKMKTVKTVKKPKANVRIITKKCSQAGCGYTKEVCEPIDPSKPWVSPY